MTDPGAPLLYQPGPVARLVFNRPEKKNALDAACWELLDQALRAFESDDDARVLVLSGADGNFSAGADLAGGITGSADAVSAKMREIAGMIVRLHEMPKPTLAQVDGVAVGVGMSLALNCDLVIASDRARMGAVFSRVGLTPDGGLSWLLPRLVGPFKAKELTLTGRLIESREIAMLGLANTVVPVDTLDAVTAEWCDRLAALPPATAAGTLRLIDDAWTTTFTDNLEAEATAQQAAVAGLRPQRRTS